MTITRERAAWLGSHIFPHEAALRQWLMRRPAPGVIDVDDVIQESYAVLATLSDVGHIRNPRTYFFQVAKSILLQTLRRSRVVTIDAFAGAELMQVPADMPSPERIVADRQELSRLAAMIDMLPARCREVFTLRRVQGLSQRQVAENLEIAESTVEKHLAKAVLLLANAVGRGGNAPDSSSKPCDDHPDTLAGRHGDGRERA